MPAIPIALIAALLASPIEIDPRQFGAVCDGVTDDAAAFNAAVRSADELDGMVLVPASAAGCRVRSMIDLGYTTNVTLRGRGSASSVLCDVTDVCIGGQTVTGAVVEDFRVTGQSSRAVSFFAPATRITVRNLDVSGATRTATRSTFGIEIRGATDCIVEDNRLEGNGLGFGPAETADIAVYAGIGNATDTPPPGYEDRGNTRVIVRRNVSASTAVRHGIAVVDASFVSVEDNTVLGPKVLSPTGIGGYGILVYEAEGFTHDNRVIGNRVDGIVGSGIYMIGSPRSTIERNVITNSALLQPSVSLPAGAISLAYSNDSVVSTNQIVGSGRAGIVLSTETNVEVRANDIDGAAEGGIILRGQVVGVLIEENRVRHAAEGISQFSDAICGQGTIRANTISETTGATSGIRLIRGVHFTIADNEVSSTGGHGIEIDHGVQICLSGNRVTDWGRAGRRVYTDVFVGEMTPCSTPQRRHIAGH